MPVGKALDAHDAFRMALGHYHKVERARAEKCLADIIDILGNDQAEIEQVKDIIDRIWSHYSRADATNPPMDP